MDFYDIRELKDCYNIDTKYFATWKRGKQSSTSHIMNLKIGISTK